MSEATRLEAGTPNGVRGARAAPPEHAEAWAEVDLDAITANVGALRAHAGAAELMAVVKADGYGHGLVPAADAALRGGANSLAVAGVAEGQLLRRAGIGAPVLVMVEPPAAALATAVEEGLTPTVYTPEGIAAVVALADGRDAPVGVHLKLDTGMRRVGVPESDWEEALRRVRDAPGVALEGLWSHLAVADEPGHPANAEQSAAFTRGRALAERLGVPPAVAHLANSPATLWLPETHHDCVRPGLSVYGLAPGGAATEGVPLRPAMALYSRVALVKRLAAGEAVSYGLTWQAPRPTRLATVPAGYADGVVRALSGLGEAAVAGRRVPMVGRVCMNLLSLDLGDTPAATGDEVCLLGRQGAAEITADDWADWLGTINYEITCRIGAAVPRVHLGGD